jgi:hypothetical protein
MGLTILDDFMSSDRSLHTAHLVPGDSHAWEVTWLPGRHMDRNSAITAMVLADLTFPVDMHERNRLWPHFEGLAAELGLTAPEALTQIANPPRREVRPSATLDDPEAAG